MNLKLTFITAFFAATALNSSAQTNSKSIISGLINDSNNKPLANATVSVLKAADSSLVKAALSADDGSFEIASANPGKFLLSYESLGFEKKYSSVFEIAAGQNYKAKTVSLKQAIRKLQDVTVTSKKPMIEIRADKTIFNVESSINATGSNALELLQKSPGIQVDNNDNISMKGKTGTKIYIDGKPTQLDAKNLAEYLKGINSNDIEAIEMISNPSAKYDASGNAGIINIKLKKNKKYGTNGSATAGLVQGITPKGNASVNLNYRNKKVNLFSNISGSIGQYENTQNLYRIQSDTLFDQRSVQNSDNKNINIKAGADFFINSKNTFGIMATTNFGNEVWNSASYTPISYNQTGQYVKTLTAFNSIPGNRNNANFNINYKYADTSGREINFDADYGSFKGRNNSYQPNYFYDGNMNLLNSAIYKNNTPINIDIYSAKVDAEQNLWKGKLGYGVKFSYVKTQNTFNFYDVLNGHDIIDLPKSNSFLYKENVNAAYINYQRQLNSKWSLQAGLRAEQTNSTGILTRADGLMQNDDSVKRSYTNLFPSAALTWTINKKNTLNLTYSRRIDRPSYQDLNPFENKLDELTYEKGNAFLRPQYTDNIELTHTFMGTVNTTIGYSHVKDYATQVLDTTNKNATYVQQQNLATEQIISFNIGSSLPIKKWWNGYANFWYNYLLFNGEFNNKNLSLTIPIYGAYLQQSFTLGKEYTAEMSGWFNGPGVWGATGTTKAQGGLDIGVQKQLFKKKATVKLTATDILGTANPWHINSNFGGLYLDGNGTWESRTIRLNFTYRFGSNQIKYARQRQTSLETEAKRIK
ncbi:MAG TPA: TonB-dependent receptor [Chitinophagaceae bacterium]|nr:TonB-dependent receptor [Chitinophagaceae bacterium]